MRFQLFRQARVVANTALFSAIVLLPGCHRAASKEEKALRAELRKAIDEQNYERAAEVARRHLKIKPLDNGTWDRLVRAQFGLNDLAAVSRTLHDWRNNGPEAALKLDEDAGDYPAAKMDDVWAVAAWEKQAGGRREKGRGCGKNTRAGNGPGF